MNSIPNNFSFLQGLSFQANSSGIGAFVEFTKRNCTKEAQNCTTSNHFYLSKDLATAVHLSIIGV